MTALKYAHEVKSALPGAYVSDVYVDMHAFGKGCEDFYRRSAEVKTLFLMYGKNEHPVIRKADPGDDCEMLIDVDELLSGETIEIPADLVILMVGMEPREDAEAVTHLVNISQDKDGWFIESHPKLDPVATTTDGVYIAGSLPVAKGHPRLCGAGACRRRPDPRQDLQGQTRDRRDVRRGGRRPLLRVPSVQRALPIQRHRVRRLDPPQPRDQRAVQGLRSLCGRLPVGGHQGPPLHR